MRIAQDMTPTKQKRHLSRNSQGKAAAEVSNSGSKLCWQTILHVHARATVNEYERSYKSANLYVSSCRKRRTFVEQMIDEASSQPALWLSRQIQRPTANFPPRNRIISPICSRAMCYHLLQHLQIPARLIHEVGQTLLMLLVLYYQQDNRYRCIFSKSLGRDHVDHLKLWSSLQEYRHPMNGIRWHTFVHWEITHLYCLPCTRSLIRRHSMGLDESSET